MGNYRLIRLLGKGRFADVYLGEHLYLNTQMALKVLHTRLSSEMREDFLIEASNLSKLIHAHIIRVLDFGVEGEIPFLVMDYAPGGTLRKRYPQGTNIALPDVVNYVIAIASALQYAHDHQMVHRNLKPENVLLGRNEEVLLSDFGINLVTPGTDSIHVREVFSAMPYMAPEQIRSKPGPASDQYALAVMVYEWLSGERPFHGSVSELYRQHLFSPPGSLSELHPEIPRSVEKVIFKALAKDPQQRFVDVRTFAVKLAEAGGVMIPAMVVSTLPTEPLPRSEAVKDTAVTAVTHFQNLPASLTSMVGREEQESAAYALLMRPDVRLMTMTGMGGVGKTRLALWLGANVLEHFTHGVCFVSLALISNPDFVIPTIVETLRLREAGDLPSFEQLKAFLHDKHLLLLLDNFEQVLAAAPLLPELLSACPRLKILVTSRAVLHVQGEHEFPILPLPLPDLKALTDSTIIAKYPAVVLFVQRAQAIKPDFQLTEDNARTIAAICVKLEGLPLAIELAAARIKLLPPYALLARLENRLQVLTHGGKDSPARQQTLRNTIGWSYGLLTSEEELLFRRLAIFAGGCTLEALDALCDALGGITLAVLDGVASLLDKSLLQQVEQVANPEDEPRLYMLETIREYGLECLAECGELESCQDAHAAYYLAFAEKVEPELLGRAQSAWVERLERERDNIRLSLQWLLEHHQSEAALRLASALGQFWFLRGYMSEGRRFLERALTVSNADTTVVSNAVKAKALYNAGLLAFWQNDTGRSKTYLEESMQLYHSQGDKRGNAAALKLLGMIEYNAKGDRGSGRVMMGESLLLYREIGERWGIADVLRTQGITAHFRGDVAGTFDLCGESLALFQEIGDSWSSAVNLLYLGWAAYIQEAYVKARALTEESVARLKALGKPRFIEEALTILSYEVFAQGDEATARALLEEALALGREVESKEDIARAYCGLGHLALRQGNLNQAQASYTEGLKHMQEMSTSTRGNWVIASSLEGLGEIAFTQGQSTWAVRLFSAAEVVRNISGYRNPIGIESPFYEHTLAALRDQLGERAFAKVWAQGQRMTLAQALAAKDEEAALQTAHTNTSVAAPSTKSTTIATPPAGLTKREFEVLLLITQGLSNAQIAEQLVLSPVTINTYLRSIYSKLGVSSRTGAMRYAIDHKLL